MKYLLDTNTCVAVLGENPEVVAKLKASNPDDCALSAVTLYELLTGAARCRHPQREAGKVRTFATPMHLLAFDADSAGLSASIRWQLEKRGTPIGPYDLLLAGQALALDLILISRNLREFQRVPGLHVESWEA